MLRTQENILALKGVRVSNGDTQESAAEFLEITRSYYSNKETDKVPFTAGEMQALRVKWKMSDEDFMRSFFPK